MRSVTIYSPRHRAAMRAYNAASEAFNLACGRGAMGFRASIPTISAAQTAMTLAEAEFIRIGAEDRPQIAETV